MPYVWHATATADSRVLRHAPRVATTITEQPSESWFACRFDRPSPGPVWDSTGGAALAVAAVGHGDAKVRAMEVNWPLHVQS